jgi:F-type H+-transporting ATPase subunit epsilon
MSNKVNLEIVTPTKMFFSGDVEALIITTPEGKIGVMSKHMPLVTVVSIGGIRIKIDGEWREAAVSEGFVKIEHDRTIIFVDTAEWPEEDCTSKPLVVAETTNEIVLKETIRSTKEIVDGKMDYIPESAFCNKGTIDEVYEVVKSM